MKQEKGSVYSVGIDLAVNADRIIFHNGGTGEGNQTGDLTLPANGDNTPYYNGASWGAKPDLSAEVKYYLVGEALNNWVVSSGVQFTASTHHETIKGTDVAFDFEITGQTVEANKGYKVVSSENHWYYKQGDSGNWSTEGAGTYNFYFKVAGFTGDDTATYYLHAVKVS